MANGRGAKSRSANTSKGGGKLNKNGTVTRDETFDIFGLPGARGASGKSAPGPYFAAPVLE